MAMMPIYLILGKFISIDLDGVYNSDVGMVGRFLGLTKVDETVMFKPSMMFLAV